MSPRAVAAAPDQPRAFPRPPVADARRSSGHLAAEYIRSLIISGELKADERVPQDELAEVLQISRIPLREGLISLEREGLIRIELNRGAFVNRFDADAVLDHYELYGLTYGLAVRRAMARGAEGLVEQLGELVKQMRSTDDPDDFRHLVLEFHSAIIEAARSPRLAASVRMAPRLVAGNFFAEVPGAIAAERRGFAAIVKALAAGDATAASDAYLSMMRKQGQLVVDLLSDRGMLQA